MRDFQLAEARDKFQTNSSTFLKRKAFGGPQIKARPQERTIKGNLRQSEKAT